MARVPAPVAATTAGARTRSDPAPPAARQDGSAFSANGVTVNADATTNTLIISAPEPVYRSLRKVIDLLDQRRAQVLVESLIVEITENDGAELGIQWLAGGGRVFGGANFGKDTFTPGGKNSIRPCPRAA